MEFRAFPAITAIAAPPRYARVTLTCAYSALSPNPRRQAFRPHFSSENQKNRKCENAKRSEPKIGKLPTVPLAVFAAGALTQAKPAAQPLTFKTDNCELITENRLAGAGTASAPAKLVLSMLRYAATGIIFAALLSAQKQPVTIDSVAAARGAELPSITWAPDGEHFISTERGELTLYEMRSGKERDIVSLDKLQNAAVPSPPPPVFDWTNRRVGESDIQWFADGKRLLVSASGDLFIVDVNKGRFEALTQTADTERDPKLSPDNNTFRFRRGPDLYCLDVATKHVTQLTNNGSDTLLNGQLDWVYPEELDLDTAHWWSPDSQSIAYLQFDISREPVFPQVSLLQLTRPCSSRNGIPKPATPMPRCGSASFRQRRRHELDGSGRATRIPAGARRLVAQQPRDPGGASESRAEQARSAARQCGYRRFPNRAA